MSGECRICGYDEANHRKEAHLRWPREDECDHEWMLFGGPGDEWRECFLCGKQEDQ